MGYYDADGFYFHQEEDIADPGAGFSELLNKPTEALPAAIHNRVVTELANDPTIEQAVIERIDAVVEEYDLATEAYVDAADERMEPLLVREADAVVWAAADARRRNYLGIRETGEAFAPIGMDTPYAGTTIPDEHTGIIGGTFDPVRRRYYQDAIGPDGRVPQSTLDDWAARLGIGGGGGGVKSAPLVLTGAASGAVVDTAPARTVRYPVQVPADATAVRVHIANRNDRTATLYPGAVSFTGLWWGEAAYTGGELTGATTAAPQQLRGAFTSPASGSEWVSERFEISTPADVDHILSLGYTTAGQTNHAGQGGAWVSTDPADASAAAPVVTRVQQAPFDVWLEFEIPADVPMPACLGDSLTLGTAATLPVHDSWPMVYGRLQKVWPVHFAHHGSDMAGWNAGDNWRWTKYGDIEFDEVIWALGSNDVSAGVDLATLTARFVALHAKVVNYLSSRIVLATIMPRNNWTPAIEAVRVQYNAWLYQRPMGAVAVVDFAKSVEETIGTVRADYIAGDGTHLTTAGYAQNALAIPGRLVH